MRGTTTLMIVTHAVLSTLAHAPVVICNVRPSLHCRRTRSLHSSSPRSQMLRLAHGLPALMPFVEARADAHSLHQPNAHAVASPRGAHRAVGLPCPAGMFTRARCPTSRVARRLATMSVRIARIGADIASMRVELN